MDLRRLQSQLINISDLIDTETDYVPEEHTVIIEQLREASNILVRLVAGPLSELAEKQQEEIDNAE